MEQQIQETFSMPRIGDKAPEFKAVTTQGEINYPSDYEGNGAFFLVILQILLQFVHQNL
jgi:peroxiredoxin (alkyl hydroperoxide reductase subunit C)